MLGGHDLRGLVGGDHLGVGHDRHLRHGGKALHGDHPVRHTVDRHNWDARGG